MIWRRWNSKRILWKKVSKCLLIQAFLRKINIAIFMAIVRLPCLMARWRMKGILLFYISCALCPKNRFAMTKDGEPGLNYLCKGYHQYFTHVAPYMDFMKRELLAERPPANVMDAIREGKI